MDDKIKKLLLEPQLLMRYDDTDCPKFHDDVKDDEDDDEPGACRRIKNAVALRRRETAAGDEDDESDESSGDDNGIGPLRFHRLGANHHLRHRNSEARGQSDNWNYAQLLFAALIDVLCLVKEPSDSNRRKRFFEKIARTLVKTGVISPICFSNQLHGLREHARLAFMQILNNAQKAVQYEDSYARNNHHLRDPPPQPSVSSTTSAPKITNRQTSLVASQVAVLPTSLVRQSSASTSMEKGSSLIVNRYRIDFEELGQLGKGGFGAVYKARHHLDGQQYAVKKIALNLYKLDSCLRALREVKSLSAMNHPNVVRYYSSWLEFDDPDPNSSYAQSRRNPAAARRSIKVQEISCESATNAYLASRKLRHCLSSPDVSRATGFVDEVLDGTHHDYYETSLPAVIEPDSDSETDAATAGASAPRFAMLGTLTLHLQMELCTSTLRKWINERNASVANLGGSHDFDRFDWVDKNPIKKLLRQLLDGLSYVHSQGIIHRDLKPSNIFLRHETGTDDPRVLLGDFGLSCCEQDVSSNGRRTTADVDEETQQLAMFNDRDYYRHSTGMGTLAYSAPEQLKSQFYDHKADMFSFGIVAVEMYYPFTTYMERIHHIMRTREGDLDDAFQRRMPLEAAIIRQLVHKKASLRPSAKQLLEEAVFVDDSQNVQALKERLREMEEELARLKNTK